MDRRDIVFHLQEAEEELKETIIEIQQDSEYDEGQFYVAMSHIYHHLNTAWNSRDASEERIKACSEKDFAAWRQFPKDIDMSI